MGWTVQTQPNALLRAGETVQFKLHFSYLPFIGVSEQLVQDALNADTPLFVSRVSESLLSILSVSDVWTVEASVMSDVTVGELSASVSTALNKWYSWGVSISEVATQNWVPDITPSTTTAVTLASITVLAVIGFMIAKKEGLL